MKKPVKLTQPSSDDRPFSVERRAPWYPSEVYWKKVRAIHAERLRRRIELLEKRLEREAAHFKRWFEARCYADDMIETRVTLLHADYQRWCQETPEHERNEMVWGTWMMDHYIRREHRERTPEGKCDFARSKYKVYLGAGLKPR